MKIITAYPPNFTKIARAFPVKGKPGILYSWGDRIYNPSGISIPPWLIAHEEIHGQQQETPGVERWWDNYLDDTQFRLEQEVEAHRREYQWIADPEHHLEPHVQERYLFQMAERLASPLYGYLVTLDHAYALIKGKSEP